MHALGSKLAFEEAFCGVTHLKFSSNQQVTSVITGHDLLDAHMCTHTGMFHVHTYHLISESMYLHMCMPYISKFHLHYHTGDSALSQAVSGLANSASLSLILQMTVPIPS